MDKLKTIRLSEEEQDLAIAANQQNISANGTLIDVNTADIADLKVAVGNFAGEDLTQLITEDQTSLVAAINEVQTEVNEAVEKNVLQDAAIEAIAADVASTKNDEALLTTLTNQTVSSTPTLINNVTITEQFTNADLAVVSNTATYTKVEVKGPATLQVVYQGNVTQNVGTSITLKSELLDIDTNTVLKVKETKMSFQGGATTESFTDFFSKVLSGPRNLAFRVSTVVAGNAIVVNDAKIDILLFGAKEVGSTGTDANVISTNNLGGGTTVKSDITYLDTALTTEVTNRTNADTALSTSITANTTAITGLDERITANEDAIINNTTAIGNNTTAIDGKVSKIDNSQPESTHQIRNEGRYQYIETTSHEEFDGTGVRFRLGTQSGGEPTIYAQATLDNWATISQSNLILDGTKDTTKVLKVQPDEIATCEAATAGDYSDTGQFTIARASGMNVGVYQTASLQYRVYANGDIKLLTQAYDGTSTADIVMFDSGAVRNLEQEIDYLKAEIKALKGEI